jgi:hypothetical protein
VVAAEEIEAMRKIWTIYMIVFSREKKRVCFHEAVKLKMLAPKQNILRDIQESARYRLYIFTNWQLHSFGYLDILGR